MFSFLSHGCLVYYHCSSPYQGRDSMRFFSCLQAGLVSCWTGILLKQTWWGWFEIQLMMLSFHLVHEWSCLLWQKLCVSPCTWSTSLLWLSRCVCLNKASPKKEAQWRGDKRGSILLYSPLGLSRATPIHSPPANSVSPMNFTTPILKPVPTSTIT